MHSTRRQLLGGLFLTATALFGQKDEDLPAFHKQAPKDKLPETRDPAQYANRPVVKRVYELAGQIRPVLYQQPCFCRCDQFAGHGSLLDCFVDNHGEECGVCQREAVYSFVRTKAGASPAQIRKEIIAGAWQKVDLSPAAVALL